MCINAQSDVQYVCNWITACCVLHNLVNSRQLAADTGDTHEEGPCDELDKFNSEFVRSRPIKTENRMSSRYLAKGAFEVNR